MYRIFKEKAMEELEDANKILRNETDKKLTDIAAKKLFNASVYSMNSKIVEFKEGDWGLNGAIHVKDIFNPNSEYNKLRNNKSKKTLHQHELSCFAEKIKFNLREKK